MALGKWHHRYMNPQDLKEIAARVQVLESKLNVDFIPVLEKSAVGGLSEVYYLKLLKAVLAFIPSISLMFFSSVVFFRSLDLWWNPIYYQTLMLLALYALFYFLFWYFSRPVLPKGLYQIFAMEKVKQDYLNIKRLQQKKKKSLLVYAFLRERIVIVYGDKSIFLDLDEDSLEISIDTFTRHAKNKQMKLAYISLIDSLALVLEQNHYLQRESENVT